MQVDSMEVPVIMERMPYATLFRLVRDRLTFNVRTTCAPAHPAQAFSEPLSPEVIFASHAGLPCRAAV